MSVIVVIEDSVDEKLIEKRLKIKDYLYFNYLFIFYFLDN